MSVKQTWGLEGSHSSEVPAGLPPRDKSSSACVSAQTDFPRPRTLADGVKAPSLGGMAPARHRRERGPFLAGLRVLGRARTCRGEVEREPEGVPQRRRSGSGFHTVLSLRPSVCESHVKVSCFVGPVPAAATFTAAAISRQESQTTGRPPSARGAAARRAGRWGL